MVVRISSKTNGLVEWQKTLAIKEKILFRKMTAMIAILILAVRSVGLLAGSNHCALLASTHKRASILSTMMMVMWSTLKTLRLTQISMTLAAWLLTSNSENFRLETEVWVRCLAFLACQILPLMKLIKSAMEMIEWSGTKSVKKSRRTLFRLGQARWSKWECKQTLWILRKSYRSTISCLKLNIKRTRLGWKISVNNSRRAGSRAECGSQTRVIALKPMTLMIN